MAIPPRVLVTGTIYEADGETLYNGPIVLQQPVTLRHADGTIIQPGSFARHVVNGVFSETMYYVDDPAWSPVGWAWSLLIPNGSLFREYFFKPSVNDTDVVNLGDIVSSNYAPTTGEEYAPINHTHGDPTAPAGAVDSVNGRTGAVVVTATDVGLGNVSNTSDANKPVSTAQALALAAKADVTALAAYQPTGDYATNTALTSVLSGKLPLAGGAITGDLSVAGYTAVHGLQVQNDLQVDGYASLQGLSLAGDLALPNLHITGSMVLDGGSTAPTAAPGTSTTQLATTAFAGAAATAAASSKQPAGDYATNTALTTGLSGKAATTHTHAEADVTGLTGDLAAKAPLASPTFTGTVGGITKSMVGLGNVDNTADSAKTFTESQITNLTTDLGAKAPLASPALTGAPTAPTATGGTNTTQIATTAFVATAVAGVGGGGGGTGNVVGPASSTDNALVRWDTTTGKLVQDSLVQATDSGSLILTPQATLAYARGLLYYDSDNECLTFCNSDSSISMQVGQEVWARVWNTSGSTITNGAPVYVNGYDATSGLPTIALANGTGQASSQVLGLTTEAITTGASGWVAVQGVVHGLNTSALTTAGNPVYLGITAGALAIAPAASPNYRYQIGYALSINASTGAIYVRPGGQAFIGWSATVNQVLGMNSAANAQEYKTIQGTANQITLTHGAGSMTFSIPSNAALPGAPTTTTPTAGDNTTKVATTAYVVTGLAAKVAGPASSTATALMRYADTTGKVALDSLALIDANGDLSGVRRQTRTFAADPVVAGVERYDLNYTVSTSTSDLFRVYVNTVEVFWQNEIGFIRGTPNSHYKDDALLRGVPRSDLTTENGGFIELQNPGRTQVLYKRDWRTGSLWRGDGTAAATKMADSMVLGPATAVPAGTPAGTIIVRTAV